MVAMLPPERSARPRAVAVAATLVTAVLLLAPLPPSPSLGSGLAALPLDKLVHAAVFFLLVRLWRRAGPFGAVPVAALATAFGGLLELAQRGLGTRSGEWQDLAADALGACVAAALPAARRSETVDERTPLA